VVIEVALGCKRKYLTKIPSLHKKFNGLLTSYTVDAQLNEYVTKELLALQDYRNKNTKIIYLKKIGK